MTDIQELANYFNEISAANEWAKYFEDEEIRQKAENLQGAILAFNDSNAGSGKIENGKKALKIVVVGDGAVGKTCLLLAFSKGEIPSAYVPTVFENFSHVMKYKNEDYILHLWDTAGQEEYDQLRPLSYSSANIFLICFSVTSSVSYDNVISKWHPEVLHYAPKVPIILVGTKLDTRNDPELVKKLSEQGMNVITTQKGEELKNRIKALKYMECSAKTGENLKNVFDEAVKTVLMNKPTETKSKCSLL